jgi:cytochrome c
MKKVIITAILLGVGSLYATQTNAQSGKYDPPEKILSLLQKNGCVSCHKADKKLMGPSYLDISQQNYSDAKILELIWQPQNNWKSKGYPPMTPMPNVPKQDGLKIAKWINSLKTK